jgi:hypothetical protein
MQKQNWGRAWLYFMWAPFPVTPSRKELTNVVRFLEAMWILFQLSDCLGR